MALLAWRVRLVVRLVLIEVYLAIMAFFLLSLYYKTKEYTVLGIVTLGVVILTVACVWAFYYINACLKRFRAFANWRVRQYREAGATTSRYEIEQNTSSCCGWCDSSTVCVYEGALVDGRPEGSGTWIDSSYQGESLRGHWHDGKPVGPFESIENDTRSVLVNLRIIVASDAGGRYWLDKCALALRFSHLTLSPRTPLRMGVASVECCVSGDFFRGFPCVDYLLEPAVCQCESRSVCECVRKMLARKLYRHIDDGKPVKSVVVSLGAFRGGHPAVALSGHRPLPVADCAPPSSVTISIADPGHGAGPRLVVQGPWVGPDAEVANEEALLFIHGFDHNLDDAAKRFGQFLALAHLPRYVVPLVFNWPSSTSHCCYWDLGAFIKSIANAKLRRLHVMCHSLGSRFFLRAFSELREQFNSISREDRARMRRTGSIHEPTMALPPSPATASSGMCKIDLANLILLNPDYDYDTFLNDFKELDLYCGRVTIYGDSRDTALKLSESLSRRRKLGTVRGTGEWPSPDTLDVIDAGDLTSNINSVAHGYFNVNKMMVDDLSEMIVTNKSAEERTTHLKKCGKIFRFTVVPSSVMVV
eukprot:m51a1_g1165 hypothetical protein (588) ;mRNA; r:353800-355907